MVERRPEQKPTLSDSLPKHLKYAMVLLEFAAWARSVNTSKVRCPIILRQGSAGALEDEDLGVDSGPQS